MTIGTPIAVAVTATDDVAVTQVALFLDGVASGVRSTPPFQFNLTTSGQPRIATLRADALDGAGHQESTTTKVELAADTEPPLVGFRSPPPGAVVFGGRSLAFDLAATDNVAVRSVSLALNGQAAISTSQYTQDGLFRVFHLTQTIPTAWIGQTIKATATATDTSGLTTTTSANLTVHGDTPPTVSLVVPALGATYEEGTELTVSALVADDDGVVGVAGLSGGQLVGTLPTTGQVDTRVEQNRVVRAPIISQGQPPRVGLVARDTTGQVGQAEVALNVLPDTEPPTAVMLVPQLTPDGGPISLPVGSNLGLEVDTTDDVYVAAVDLLVDGGVFPGGPWLSSSNGQKVTTRVADPAQPGNIILSTRWTATYKGSPPLGKLPPGTYTVNTRTRDLAGNATETTPFQISIAPFVDREAPGVALELRNTPGPNVCVAGAPAMIALSASDDGLIDGLSLRANGVDLPLDWHPPVPGANLLLPFVAPSLNGGDRDVSFVAIAHDTAGHTSLASLLCALISDSPPSLALAANPATLTEEKMESFAFSGVDDVGLRKARIFLTNTDLSLADGGTVTVPLAETGSNRLQVRVANTVSFTTSVTPTEWRIPPAEALTGLPPAAGALQVETDGPAQLKITYRYALVPGQESSAAAQAFLALAPGGVRTVSLQQAPYVAILDFPTSAVRVLSVRIDVTSSDWHGPQTATVELLPNPQIDLEKGARRVSQRPARRPLAGLDIASSAEGLGRRPSVRGRGLRHGRPMRARARHHHRGSRHDATGGRNRRRSQSNAGARPITDRGWLGERQRGRRLPRAPRRRRATRTGRGLWSRPPSLHLYATGSGDRSDRPRHPRDRSRWQ